MRRHLPKFTSSGNAVVVGLGKSGVACANYLINDGWNVEVCDVVSRPYLEKRFKSTMPGIPIHAPLYPQLFLNTDLVAMSCTSADSDKSILRQAEKYGAEVVSSLDLFFQRCSKPTIAVSGTNGKSSVTSLISHVIEKSGHSAKIGGCGGVPFLDLLNSSDSDLYLLELSSLQLEQVKSSISPSVATILNAFPDHLERYESEELYISAMSRIVKDARTAVINREDARVANLPTSGERITFGRDPAKSARDFGVTEKNGARWISRGTNPLINLEECQLQGTHNELNLLAACAILAAAGFSVESAAKDIADFAELPYRCSFAGEWDEVRWINDARSSNVAATMAAVQTNEENPVVLILGGLSKTADFSEVAEITNGRLRGCIFFGRDAQNISQGFSGQTQMVFVESISEAIIAADSLSEAGDSVIFSPGCAGYDMFTSYLQRGKVFSQALESFYR